MDDLVALVAFLQARFDEDAAGRPITRARLLGEVDAKRQIVTEISALLQSPWGAGPTAYQDALMHVLCLLALPHERHRDYRAEWKP